ncbi:MAG: efflux RND transporter periplasmic adaptor subunit, partial [Balneolaceae bacterium]|nr:efflux RND transporter periplasmic adaptor subunit [Balneolaceae bacterium]
MPKTKHLFINKMTRLLAAAALLLTFTACGNQDEGQGESGSAASFENIPAVEAVQARFGSLPLSERLSGTVIAKNQVQLYPEISGRISEVIVQNGDKVSKGAP